MAVLFYFCGQARFSPRIIICLGSNIGIIVTMDSWAFYPVFVGTIISIIGWVAFVRREHDAMNPATLSMLAARKRENIRYFRLILWVCGPLFGLTAIFFIAPHLQLPFLTSVLILMVGLEMLVGVFPPVDKMQKMIHEIIAYAMALSMAVAGVMLALSLPRFGWMEWLLVGLMLVCATFAVSRRTAFIFYELGFIFMSHITLVVAALALIS